MSITVKAATLHDTTSGAAQDTLINDYNATPGDDGKTIIVTGKNLARHTNGEGKLGFWAGVEFVAPEGAAKFQYALGNKALSVPTNFEEGTVGLALYTDVATLDERTIKIQWLSDDDTLIGDEEIYTLDFSGITLKAETAASTATLSDHLTHETQDTLISDYALTTDGDTIKVTGSDLMLHANGNDANGYWAGVEFKAPEGATAYRYAIGDGEMSDWQTSWEPGTEGLALYADVATQTTRTITIEWRSESGATFAPKTYTLDFSGVDLHGEATATTAKLYDEADGNTQDKLVSDYKVTTDGNTIKITGKDLLSHTNGIGQQGYWAGVEFEAPEGAKTFELVKDGKPVDGMQSFEPGTKGFALYTDVATQATREVTVTWYSESGAKFTTQTYTLDFKGVDLGAEATVSTAKLGDTSTGATQDTLITDYAVTKDGDTIKVEASNVLAHTNAQGKVGYWAGVNFTAPEGATQFKIVIDGVAEPGMQSFEPGTNGFALYTDVANKPHREVKVEWFSASGASFGEKTYKLDFTGVALNAEATVSTGKLADEKAGTTQDELISEDYTATLGEGGKITVTGSNLLAHTNAQGNLGYWAGVEFIAPEGAEKFTLSIDGTDKGMQSFEPGTQGFALYTDVVADSSRTVTVQWFSAAGIALGAAKTYELDFSGITLNTASTITPAKLDDRATETTEDNLVKDYNVTLSADGKIAVTGKELQAHTNGEGDCGHWVGVEFIAPEGATHFKYALGDGELSDPCVNEDGTKGMALYTNVAAQTERTITIQWCKKDGDTFANIGTQKTYELDFSGITLDTVSTITPAKLDDRATESTEDKLIENYEVALGVGGKITVTGNELQAHTNGKGDCGYWVGVEFIAPEGATHFKYALGDGELSDLCANEDGTKGMALYTNVATQTERTITIQWCKEDGSTVGTAKTYEIDLSGVDLDGEATISTGKLADKETGDTQDKLIGEDYTVTLGEGDTIKITGSDLKLHTNGVGKPGYWAGVEFTAPEGAKQFKIVIDGVAEPGMQSFEPGTNGFALYTDVATQATRTVTVEWFSESGASFGQKTYTLDFTGVTLSADITVSEATLFDTAASTAQDKLVGSDYDANLGEDGTIKVTGSNLVAHMNGAGQHGFWAGVEFAAPTGATQFRIAIDGGEMSAAQAFEPGTNGFALYTDVEAQATREVTIEWLTAEGVVFSQKTYTLDFSEVTLKELTTLTPDTVYDSELGTYAATTTVTSGSISKQNGKVETYEVVNLVANTATISLEGLKKGEKIKVSLVDANGKVLKKVTASANKKGEVVMKNFMMQKGEVYLQVESLQKKGEIDYKMTIEQEYFKAATPNTNIATAAETIAGDDKTEAGKDVTGWVGYGDKVDTYTIAASDVGKNIDIKFTNLTGNVKATLVDENGKKLKSISLKASSNLEKSKYQFNDILVESGKTVYLYVEASGSKTYTADYTVNISQDHYTAASANNDLYTATKVLDTATHAEEVTGWVGYQDKKDVYCITGDDFAKALSINFTNLTGNVKATLVDENGKKIKSISLKPTTTGKYSFNNILIAAGKTAYLYVETVGKKNLDTGYSISFKEDLFTKATEDSRFDATTAAAFDSDGKSSNTGWVGYSDAADYYQFELATSRKVSFDLADLAEGYKEGKQVSIKLYNAETNKEVALSSKGTAADWITKQELSAGKYCVAVSIQNETKYNTDYTLNILA